MKKNRISKYGALLAGCAIFFSNPIITAQAAGVGDSSMPDMYGSVIYADGWSTQQNAIGMYRIPTGPEMEFTSLSTARIDASSGGVLIGDTYWTCNFVDYLGTPFVMVTSYDARTWEEKSFKYAEPPMIATAVAYDTVTKKAYGCFRNDSNTGYVFGTADYNTLTRTRICDLPRMWSAMAIDRQGIVYAIDELGDLYIVSKENGEMTLIGSTGLMASHPSSACIDYRTGRMFYALTDSPKGSLYEIDKSTATYTLVYDFPQNQEVVGMFIPLPDADEGAPDSPSNLSLQFNEGALSGMLSFTAPDMTFGGQPGNGALSYTLEGNGQVVTYGSCDWGDDISVAVSVATAGQYDFRLYLSNDQGNSPAVERSMFVGPDTPVAPGVSMTYTDHQVLLTLSPVTSTLHGGYADYANMQYNVTRLPDNVSLTAQSDGVTFSDFLSPEGDLRSYQYAVTASYGEVSSAEVLTEKVWTGAATPPYTSIFDNFEATEPYIVVNANGDAQTWKWNEENLAFFTTFNRNSDNDDWLMTPALRLEKGKIYKATVTLRTYLGNPEYAEIACGTTPTPEGMTMQLLGRTQIKTKAPKEYVVYITPEQDGIHHLGVHSVSPASDSWYLYVDSIIIEEGVSNDVPAQMDAMEIIPDFNGELKAEISITAPTKTGNGNILDSIDRIELRRDGDLIKLFDSPAPGASLSWTDHPSAPGYHTYIATAFNQIGEGRGSEKTVFVGVNSPAKPEWAKIEETSTPGKVRVSWSPVTKAADGTPMNPDLVTYDIMTVDETHDGEAYNAAEGVAGTECVLEVPGASTTQKFAYYAVKAITASDYSLMTLTPFLPVGPAYQMPYKESFAGGKAKSLMRPDNGMAMWSIYTDDSGIPANDGDRGMAAMFGELNGADASLYSGKIDLGESLNPVLSFYTFNITGNDPDLNELYVSVGVGTDFTEVKSVIMSELGDADGWYPVIVPLDEYKGQEIQICFRGVTRNRKFTLIDNITVSDGTRLDLKAGLLSAPYAVAPGQEFNLEAAVENVGREDVEQCLVTLFRNGQEIASDECGPIAAGKTRILSFPQVLNATCEELNEYRFLISFDEDENPANNESENFRVNLQFAPVAEPLNLRGECDENGVSLSWDEPDMTTIPPATVTEDFEDWTSWDKSGEKGWVFVDRDLSGIGSIQNLQLPGIDYNSLLSWFVMDASMEGLSNDYTAASGDKYLSTMFCLPLGDFQYIANDDWAISPLLFGGQQTISLMARSVNPYEAEESFEILYTTEDSQDPDRFLSLAKVNEVPGLWTSYSFVLPDGAKRFAIRYDKTYGFMLHVDDVTYIPAGHSELTLSGYNVYREGELASDTPLSGREYTDDYLCTEETRYAVSAIYSDSSESRASAPILLKVGSGMREAIKQGISIRGKNGAIVVTGATGDTLSIHDTAGRLITTRRCATCENIPLPSGLYIVSVGTATAKIHL